MSAYPLPRAAQDLIAQRAAVDNPAVIFDFTELFGDREILEKALQITGAQRDDVRAVLEASPVGEVITVVVAEEDVRRGKPVPEGFLASRPTSSLTCCRHCEVQEAGDVSTRAWVSRSPQDFTRIRVRSERK